MTLPHKTILVTGAARRIGRALAIRMAKEGWDVAIHYRSSRAEAGETARAVEAEGRKAYLAAADFNKADEVEALFPALREQGATVTALINNASFFHYDTLATLTAESFTRHLYPNLLAPALLSRDLYRFLPEGQTGAIINLLDQKLWNLNPDFQSYTLSKAGLLNLTQTAAMAMAPKVRVNGIAPGLILISGKQTEESYRAAYARTPFGRNGDVDQIGDAAAFILASPWMTGQTLMVDYGQHLFQTARDVAFEKEGAAV